MKYGLCSLAWQSPFGGNDPAKFYDEVVRHFEKAKKFGFDIFEVAVENYGYDVDATIKAAKETGIELKTVCGAFGPTRDCSSDDPEYRKGGIKYTKYLVDIISEFGGEAVVGPIYSAVGKTGMWTDEEKEQHWAWAVESIKELADYAAAKGIKLGIEPLNRFETNLINTTEQCSKLIERIDKDNVGYLLDSFHMNIEESSIPDAIRLAGDKIIDFHTCANNRGTPGEDNFNWPAIKQAIDDVGYDGYCVIESFTPDCVEIAAAASVWRPFAPSPDYLAENGVKFLKSVFG
ncbi:MAG: sugar phosphate isomerase/epimerase [Christensenellaceae bacterium]|nr:sugar phosphate isomerase/epimerase [Christensenellaceae bacterium]